MSKNILVIIGHPNKHSFNFQLASSYIIGAESKGAIIKKLILKDLNFNYNLEHSYDKKIVLEPDLSMAQELILWANHIVWFYPVWWGSMPAVLKGFIDRTFLPDFAFKKKKNSFGFQKLLTNKSSRIISTLDQPTWYYYFKYGAPSHRAMKYSILEFCGFSPVKITSIGPISGSSLKNRIKWLDKLEKIGNQDAISVKFLE